MDKIERAVRWALDIARDATHGYDQSRRWGPDYDCSALVISAYEQAGVPVKSAGATYTGNMRRAFKSCGFTEVTDGTRERGDVLLCDAAHTALYIGDGQLVHASINEKGGVTGGQSGDQTGREICVRDYYDRPWDCVLRYTHAQISPELRRGDMGHGVFALQHLLLRAGCALPDWGADGDFGAETEAALREFQRANGLEADGVCAGQTWDKLTKGRQA